MRLNGYSLARYEPDDELDGIWTREQLLEMGAPVRGLRFFTRVAVRPLAPDAPSGRTRRADRASAPAAIDLGSGAYLEMAPFYRPEAPNDGWGRIELTAEEMLDLDRLDQEARDYALAWSFIGQAPRSRAAKKTPAATGARVVGELWGGYPIRARRGAMFSVDHQGMARAALAERPQQPISHARSLVPCFIGTSSSPARHSRFHRGPIGP